MSAALATLKPFLARHWPSLIGKPRENVPFADEKESRGLPRQNDAKASDHGLLPVSNDETLSQYNPSVLEMGTIHEIQSGKPENGGKPSPNTEMDTAPGGQASIVGNPEAKNTIFKVFYFNLTPKIKSLYSRAGRPLISTLQAPEANREDTSGITVERNWAVQNSGTVNTV
ncbi:hypothetical protein BX600DRAFT_443172 [Xylariales sp. PMI_506]|nr:hypothetical protein BX600DRAFT_443172 [Xylariales sp. PMI_506]